MSRTLKLFFAITLFGQALTQSAHAHQDDSLHMAIKSGEVNVVKAFIDDGLNPDHIIQGDGSLLILATKYRQTALAKLLVARGADVNLAVSGDASPLIMASRNDDMTLTRFFIANGADVNIMTRSDESPLIAASHYNNLAMAEYLIAQGADVNLGIWANGKEYRNPLNQAGSSKMAALLQAHGATLIVPSK